MLTNSDGFITGLTSDVPGTYTVFYDVTSSTITPTGDTVVCVEQTRSTDIVVRDIIQLLLPDAFTPNGDGLNDIFAPSNPSLDIVSLDIFNRWGEQVYSYDGTVGTVVGIIKTNNLALICTIYKFVMQMAKLII